MRLVLGHEGGWWQSLWVLTPLAVAALVSLVSKLVHGRRTVRRGDGSATERFLLRRRIDEESRQL
ncbi:MAG: hypothetical protein ACRDZ1_08735 [Acidimicrobiia bacterium]